MALGNLFFRPIALGVIVHETGRGQSFYAAPSVLISWGVSPGGGGGGAYGHMQTAAYGYGQGGQHGSSYGSKLYNRIPNSSTVSTRVGGGHPGGAPGEWGATMYSNGGAPGYLHSPESWAAPRGSLPKEWEYYGERNWFVRITSRTTYYGHGGWGGTPPPSGSGYGESGKSGYQDIYRRVR